MKVVILAGGYGTRISEESHLKPKPMVEIGGRPILWHIMKHYSYYGYDDFVICLGYKGYYIKEYFAHYFLHEADVTFDFKTRNNEFIHHHYAEPWRVTLVNTGVETMTGGRVRRIKEYVNNETFMLTYGDGVSNVDINQLVDFHRSHGKIATISSVQLGSRFGVLDIEEEAVVKGFQEKPMEDGSWVNAGFMVLEPSIFDYLYSDETILEREPMNRLADIGELMTYKHEGFWQPMDTLRDKNNLEDMWKNGNALWKVWSDNEQLLAR